MFNFSILDPSLEDEDPSNPGDPGYVMLKSLSLPTNLLLIDSCVFFVPLENVLGSGVEEILIVEYRSLSSSIGFLLDTEENCTE